MRSRIIKSNEQRNNWEEFNKIEKLLHSRERKLLKREEALQRKIKEYDKRANCRAKADLRAAAKYREARKKLLFALDTRDKLQECHSRNCKANKFLKKVNHARQNSKQKKVNPFTDVVFDLCDKLLSGPSKQNNIFSCKCLRPYMQSRYLEQRSTPNNSSRGSRETNILNLAAGDCYLRSLPTTPQLWMYHRWPQFYPHYLNVRKQWKNMGFLTLFIVSALFWLPALVCLELCKCFFCACCCDF